MSQIIQCTYLHTAQFYGSHRHPRSRPRSVILQCGGVEKCHEGNLKIHLCFEISPAGPGRCKLANNCG